MAKAAERDRRRDGAEIVYGAENCQRKSAELLEELGFPRGVLPLKGVVECGRVRETGFVWMKQKAAYEHHFTVSNTRVCYGVEVTAFVERLKMKKMTGVRSRQVMLWVPITGMSIDGPLATNIHFSTPVGLGRSFPITAFLTDQKEEKEEKNQLLLPS